jgi:lipopolysaccharide export system protein LptA
VIRRAVLLSVACATAATAQETARCTIEGNTQTVVTLPSGQRNSFMGGGVLVRCPSKELTLRADSLESYGDEGRVFMLGHVRYNEPRLALTSDFLTYYQRDERIVANGNVDATLPSGSRLRGPFAEYYRTIPNQRPATRLFANGRPAITIVQKDSAGQPSDPVNVLANNATMIGDSLVYAGGSVQVTRTEVEARGDSMALDSQTELMVMMRNPVIEGRKNRPFTLSGDRIELTSKLRKLQRVLSKGKAKAVSEDMTLTSDTIDLRVGDDLLQRAIAWGPTRARAFSPSQEILADSIDVAMPGQRVTEMHAVRSAIAQGRPDTIRFRADTLDWLRGDTIVALFDTTVARDSARTRLRELTARGHARSYHHLPAADSTIRRPAINYVTGREIIVSVTDQRVSKVTVIEQAAGVYAEPKAQPAAAPPPAPTSASPPIRPPARPAR